MKPKRFIFSREHSTNLITYLVTCLVLVVTVSGCAPSRPPVPPGVVPKPRTPTISDEQYGHTILQGLSEQFKIDYSDPRVDNVTTVVDRLTAAAGASKDPWHVYLFHAPDVKNAAATRGNHVFIWSGMLDFVGSDDELATILGHEIAHVLAGHTDPDPNEELKRLLIGLGSAAAGIAAAQATNSPSIAGNVGRMTSTITEEVGSGLFINPYSRERELEADHIGLFLMADAGYNPNEALRFWRRVQNDPAFSSGAEFFSTHPPPVDRTSMLQSHLPQALIRFEHAIKPGSPVATSGAQGSAPPKEWERKYYADHSTNPTKDNKDTFNWNDKLKESSTSDFTTWTVRPPIALLYSRPDLRSRPLGEFRQGAMVQGKKISGAWIEIEKPDRGYLSVSDVISH